MNYLSKGVYISRGVKVIPNKSCIFVQDQFKILNVTEIFANENAEKEKIKLNIINLTSAFTIQYLTRSPTHEDEKLSGICVQSKHL